MSDTSLNQLVKSLKDSEPAILQLMTTAGHVLSCECVYKESTAPQFFVLLPPGTMPKDIDTAAPCTVNLLDGTGTPVSMTSRILSIASDRSIELRATKVIDPASLREYFRVGMRTAITLSCEGQDPSARRPWSLQGQTLDISGSGVLGLFTAKPKSQHNLFIHIRLTHPEKRIQCIGHVVRMTRLRNNRWQTALHFDNIAPKDQDAIIANCLWEQRRQLRELVQVSGA